MPRIQFQELKAEFKRVLIKKGCDEASADLSAQLMTETSCDGVYSHGVNRFPRFVEQIRKGDIVVDAEPEKLLSLGAIEQWDAHRAIGNLTATAMMDRAMELAAAHGQPFEMTLTGFKWIGRVPGLAFGYEEAIGYCTDPSSVPDKDGITTAVRVLDLGAGTGS